MYRLTLLTLLATGAMSITSAPGPVLTNTITDTSSGPSVTSAAASASYSSTSTCGSPAMQFESYCCSGELLYPQATGSPQGTYTTDLAARSEPNAIVPSHSLPILSGTVLASGVTCFGSVATVGAGTGAGGSGSGSGSGSSTTSSSSMSGSGTSSSSTGVAGTTTSSGASATTATSSGAIVGSSTPAGSFTTSSGPTVSGGAVKDAASGSFVGGLVGLVVALL